MKSSSMSEIESPGPATAPRPRIRVAVLMGGRSTEREVSLSTGRQVLGALDPAKYDAFPVDVAHIGMLPPVTSPGELPAAPAGAPEAGGPPAISPDAFAGKLAPAEAVLTGRNRPDVALICLHGKYGEDGTIQGMLELLGIPYTGSGVLASALAMNKVTSKKLFQVDGIPTPAWTTVRGRAEADAFLKQVEAGTAPLDVPLVVKPSEQGSTIGISIVHDRADLPAALETALVYDPELLIEQYVEGIEITGAVLGNAELECLPLVEIVPASGFYDYEAKYTPGATDEIVPARISPEQTRRAQELAIRAHRSLGCRGFSRTDMLVAGESIWVLEVNTIPGMTPTSLLPRAADAAGIAFPSLLERMIELALEDRTRESTPSEARTPAH